MKKMISALCIAGMYFGIVTIVQAELPYTPDLSEIIQDKCCLIVFASFSDKPINDMDGFEAPRVAGWSPQEPKRIQPPTVQATDQKKVQPSEIKFGISAAPYVHLPSPSMSEAITVLAKSKTYGIEEMRRRDDKLVLSPTESKSKIFTYYPDSALTIHSGSYGALHEAIAYLEKNPSARVSIRAYSDSSTNIARSLALTQKRILDIRNYFILHDISDEIITAEIRGAASHPESNKSEEISPLNNRVEIIIR